jgi:putative FmdB family regulatory protein
MPKYQYACTACDSEFEIKRSFADVDQPTHCPQCGQPAARKLTLFGYVKGGGTSKPAPLQKDAPKAHAAGCPCCTKPAAKVESERRTTDDR